MSPVRHEVSVRCSLEHAFHVFTTRIDTWWPPSHRRIPGSTMILEPGIGGRLEERGDDRALPVGKVVVWSPPARLELAWALGAPDVDRWTRVTVTFEQEDAHIRVRVVHVEGPEPLPDWEQTARIFVRAWAHVLQAFVEAAER